MKRKVTIMLLCCGMLLLAGCGKKNTVETQPLDELTQPEDVPQAHLPALTEEETEEETEDTDVHFAPADLTCVLPKGFQDNGDNEGLYVHKSYPSDISTISHVISDEGEDISQWSAEDFKAALEQDYYNTYGDYVSIEIAQSDKLTVDGRPGYRILMEFTFKGVDYEQLMYALFNGDEVHYLFYTQEKGGKWMDEFVKSGETIHFVDIT